MEDLILFLVMPPPPKKFLGARLTPQKSRHELSPSVGSKSSNKSCNGRAQSPRRLTLPSSRLRLTSWTPSPLIFSARSRRPTSPSSSTTSQHSTSSSPVRIRSSTPQTSNRTKSRKERKAYQKSLLGCVSFDTENNGQRRCPTNFQCQRNVSLFYCILALSSSYRMV